MRIVAGVAVVVACGDGGAPTPERPRPVTAEPGAPAGPGPEPGAPAVVVRPRLAAEPRLDLAANHVRFQLHDRGLVIPVGGVGLAPYDLEYKRPWGDAAVVDGIRARRLRARSATLTAPWPGGAGQLAIRARGARRIAVAVDGKPVGAAAFAGGGWEVATVDVAELAPCDHAFTLTPDRKGTSISSVELLGAGAGAGCAADPRPATALVAPGALGGWPRLAILVEIPADAYLVVTPAGGGAAQIAVRPHGGDARVLWSGPADGAEHAIDLRDLAGQLVELAFEASCAMRWNALHLAFAAHDLPPAAKPVDNVVLVVVDTLRADRIAAIASTRVQTPRLTELARTRGVAFRRHQSMSPSSPPSHATIHTGQIPRVHGAIADDQPLRAEAPVLSAVLRDAGFFTGYVGNNDFAMGRIKKVARFHAAHAPVYAKGIDCDHVFRGAVELVRAARARRQRYFVTALPIQPHLPYRYHEGITDKYFAGPWPPPVGKRVTSKVLGRLRPGQWDQVRALYDGEVENLDRRCLSILFDGLAELGAMDDTAIVITSDHGEGMGERGGRYGHAYSLNRELIHVPLVVLGSGLPPASVDVVTSAVDVAPTVLELLGLPVDRRMQGAGLLGLARRAGRGPARVVASEYGRAYAITSARWRYIVGYDNRGKLHDLQTDPEEARDVSPTAPMPLRYLRGAAGLHLAHRTAWRTASWGTLADLAPGNPLSSPPP